MPDRRPLVNGGAGQVREIPAGDSLLVPGLKHLGATGSDEGQPVFDPSGNLLRRQPGSVGRYYTTQYGIGSSSGQWAKLATATLQNGFRLIQFEVTVTHGYTGRGGLRAAVSLATGPTSGFQTIEVRVLSGDKAPSRLVAVRTKNYPVDGANEVELWYQADGNWLNACYSFSSLLVDSDSTFAPVPTGGTWSASPSAGTQYAGVADWLATSVTAATVNVGQWRVTHGTTVEISEGAEILLVRAQYLIGEIEMLWSAASNRVERMLIDVSSLNYYDGEVLSITRYVSYQNAGVFGTVRLRQDAGSTMRYLTVTVQNLNGGTAGIAVVVRGQSSVGYVFGETLPGGTSVLKSIATPSRADHIATTGGVRLEALTGSRMASLDANKRVQTLDAAASRNLIGAAPLDSPAFTGTPTVPTASLGTNTTQAASTAFVRAEVAALADSAPATLDTLNELAAALGDDPNFATTVTNSLATKAVAVDVNLGTAFDTASNPFHATQRFTDFDKRGGVRTWNAIGPFSASQEWYNVVDVRHRNGSASGATGYGGELVWGMINNQAKLAFRSRGVDGTPSAWVEPWTKAEISDANMPRLNGTNAFTGQSTFYGDLRLLTNGLSLRSGAGGSGYGSGGWFANEYTATSEPYNGLAGSYSANATRSSVGVHTDPNSPPSAGIAVSSTAEGATPVFDIIKASSMSLSTDVHTVNGANVTMTKMRSVVTDSAARNIELPNPAAHSIAIVMVSTDATTGFHSVNPPTGSELYWTDHTGATRYTAPAGAGVGSAFRMTRGMYWFTSDGTYWYAMSPARVS